MPRTEAVHEMKNERCKAFVNTSYFIPIPSSEWYVMDRGRTARPTTRSAAAMFSKKRLKGERNVLNGSLTTATQIRRFPGTVINIRSDDIAEVMKESV